MSEERRHTSLTGLPDSTDHQAPTLPEPAMLAAPPSRGSAPTGLDETAASCADGAAANQPPTAASSPSTPALGIPKSLLRWERYEIVALLGAGGMGAVYKARDPRLGRLVALKLIHPGLGHDAGASGELIVRRFHREARLQAALDHPHVCKVYEIGELPGNADEQLPRHPYIAMQLIAGQPLHRAQQEMSLLDKVRIIQQVAEALQAAHHQGLIHRDIKPGNIMVERTPTGELHPYVMDFGLAREVNAAGPSRMSVLEGTPRYMAPEQARGDTRHFDRRTDVYSLGVTLYELLTGHPPFGGDSEVDILLAVLMEEPRPLRALDKSIPADLEAITLKCLEKEPAARYDSAKALAEDLERYLSGEPVQARRVSVLERAYRKARRHKVAAASIGLAVGALLSLGILMVRAQLQSARDFERAEELGQDVKELELFLRYANALPLHDIGREQAVIGKRMDDIAAQVRMQSGQAAALVEYALGRGYLALGEPARARAHFVTGLQLGYRAPDVHYALGRALGELYQRGLDEVRFAGTPGWQMQQREKLKREFLEPALRELQQGQGQRLEPASYAQGILAYQSGSHVAAMQYAKRTQEEAPWMYEADLLTADSLRALGEAAHLAGQHKESIELYEQAAVHYRAAREVGRSDPQVHSREAQLWIQRIEVEADAGNDPNRAGQEAFAASDRAIASQRQGLLGYQAKAHSLMRILHYKQSYGQDPGHLPEEILALAKSILRYDPNNAPAYYFLAVTNIIKFSFAMEHGQPGTEYFDEGISYYKKTLELKPDYSRAYNDLGCAYGLRAQWLGQHGEPFEKYFADSVRYLRRAMEEDDSDAYPKYNLCDIGARYMKLQLANGQSDFALLTQAREIEKWFAKQNRHDYALYSYVGLALIPKLAFAVTQGDSVTAAADEALGYFAKALAENPKFPDTERGRAEVLALQSLDALLSHRDATATLEAGLAAAAHAIELSPGDASGPLLKARLLLYQARARQGAAQLAAIGAGEAAARRAIELDGESADARVVLAQLAALRGEAAEGLELITATLRINPRHAEALATRAALLQQQRELLSKPAAKGPGAPTATDSDLQQQAQQALTQALSINRLLLREYAPLLKILNRPPHSAAL